MFGVTQVSQARRLRMLGELAIGRDLSRALVLARSICSTMVPLWFKVVKGYSREILREISRDIRRGQVFYTRG